MSCYLVACKWEGIPSNSHFFSAEVAADIVKLGVCIEDVKAIECKVLNCLGWEIPTIFPSECCLFLFQAHKLSNWDGKSQLGLSLNSWMKDVVQEICKVCLEEAVCPSDFSCHGFTAALGCFMLIGKACEQQQMRSIFRYFLHEKAQEQVFQKALSISTWVSNSSKDQQHSSQAYSTSASQGPTPTYIPQPADQTNGAAIPPKISKARENSSSTSSTQATSAAKPQTPANEQQQRRKRPAAARKTQKQSPRCSRSEAKIRPPSFRLRNRSDSAEVLELCCREYFGLDERECEREFVL